ncbi:tagaturonate reductase [Rapidithrix thailandica]|uniref:Tagaturonate reductase n=1 Tax=Rapidithrix thailandica TaxID=413964 RepID=A0AAW9S4Z4_9BACT
MKLEILSRKLLHSLDPAKITLPTEEQLSYPEKVLQFGTGAFLRAFVEDFIDRANRIGKFKGRVVMVGSTGSARTELLKKQEGLYTLRVEGICQGEAVVENRVISSISRVLSAQDEWDQVLACVRNPALNLIVSNTTEAGIRLQKENIYTHLPVSFPGKLTACLWERYKAFDGEEGMTILPCELVVNNGTLLKSMVIEQARFNHLEEGFFEWLREKVSFRNTLVDRIVPGTPDSIKKEAVWKELGYQDEMLNVAEVYRLWAIEGSESLSDKFPFLAVDPGIILQGDISSFRERKLRILNGGHTISVAVGFLAHLKTVSDCLEDALISEFISTVILNEIVPALENEEADFALEVLDRFRNPHLNHHLLSIALQYSSKMESRNAETFFKYFAKFQRVPSLMTLGFAAFMYFMRVKPCEVGFMGCYQGVEYEVEDQNAKYFSDFWKDASLSSTEELRAVLAKFFEESPFWKVNFNAIPNFSDSVAEFLIKVDQLGVRKLIELELTKLKGS